MKALRISLKTGTATGILLIVCMVFSIIIANTSWGEAYLFLWHKDFFGHPLAHWINDGLMAVFFLLVGLELKRELLIGHLSSFSKAILPAAAALGGMVAPAAIYWAFNSNLPTLSGFGIVMSTDIAFVVGVMALLSNRIPQALKVFMLALAVVDDLGAIIVIALFYSSDLQVGYLLMALGVLGLLLVSNKMWKIDATWLYILGGITLWLLVMQSGIHASLAGIMLAMAVPFRHGFHTAPAHRWEHKLHRPVYLLILPLFVLSNTAIVFSRSAFDLLLAPHSIGIVAGLLIGKPLGIYIATRMVIRLRWAELPSGLYWHHIAGGGFLGGIGFTMAIFVTLLSFNNQAIIDSAKLAIIVASFLSATIGILILTTKSPKHRS